MVQKVLKSIITVFVIMGCTLVALIGFAYYLYEKDNMDYEFRYNIAMGEVTDVEVIPIGKTYSDKTSEDGIFYEVYVTFKNTGNYSADYRSVDLEFLEYGPDYTDRAVRLEYLFGYPQGAQMCVPAGKESTIKRVIELSDDCESLKMIYVDGFTKEEQVFNLDIMER